MQFITHRSFELLFISHEANLQPSGNKFRDELWIVNVSILAILNRRWLCVSQLEEELSSRVNARNLSPTGLIFMKISGETIFNILKNLRKNDF